MGDTRSSIDTPWLCYPEAAEYLRVALGTLRNMVSVGSVPFVRRKGIVRFHRDDLDRWLRQGERHRRHALVDLARTGAEQPTEGTKP